MRAPRPFYRATIPDMAISGKQWVGQRQDGLALADGEAFDGAEGGVGQLGAQAFDGVCALGVIALGSAGGALFGEEGELVGHQNGASSSSDGGAGTSGCFSFHVVDLGRAASANTTK